MESLYGDKDTEIRISVANIMRVKGALHLICLK